MAAEGGIRVAADGVLGAGDLDVEMTGAAAVDVVAIVEDRPVRDANCRPLTAGR